MLTLEHLLSDCFSPDLYCVHESILKMHYTGISIDSRTINRVH